MTPAAARRAHRMWRQLELGYADALPSGSAATREIPVVARSAATAVAICSIGARELVECGRVALGRRRGDRAGLLHLLLDLVQDPCELIGHGLAVPGFARLTLAHDHPGLVAPAHTFGDLRPHW